MFTSKKTDDQIAAVFRLYHIYRPISFNRTISNNDQMYRFKEKFKVIDKITKEIVNQKFKSAKTAGIEIYVKEKNEKKVYIEEIIEDEKKEEKKIKPEIIPKTSNEKTFIVKGGYKDIANALIKRGWKQILDVDEQNFDYFYPLINSDIKYEKLKPNQLVSHFCKAKEITRKLNLIVNLRVLYFRGFSLDNFFPRAYCLSEKNDLEDFLEDFKVEKAFCILKNCINKNGKNVNKEVVMTAYNIIKRRECLYFNEKEYIPLIKSAFRKNFSDKEIGQEFVFKPVSDEEWNIIGQEDMDIYNKYMEKLIKSNILSRPNYKSSYNFYLTKKDESNGRSAAEKELDRQEKLKLEENVSDLQSKLKMFALENLVSFKNKEIIPKNIKKKSTDEIEIDEEKIDESDEENPNQIGIYEDQPIMKRHLRPPAKPEEDDLSDKLFEIKMLIEKLGPYLPENVLEGSKNLWICKPGGLSRGRGIYCIDQLNDLLNDIKSCGHTIIQKYIENPLIILNRKFDIRQWVLLTDLSPLTIWLWMEPYFRFSAEDYKENNFSNTFAHLTNNSIAKHSAFFKETPIKDNMWFLDEFRKYIVEYYGEDYWPEIHEKIKKIVILSLVATKHKLFDRKNCHEVFGYDFMIDQNLNVYLIEINASPDWSYSTHVTEKLVKEASEDIIKVVIDYTENEKNKNSNNIIDTGKFKKIYCSNEFPNFESVINKIQRKKIKD